MVQCAVDVLLHGVCGEGRVCKQLSRNTKFEICDRVKWVNGSQMANRTSAARAIIFTYGQSL
jgi:hypothetical protein